MLLKANARAKKIGPFGDLGYFSFYVTKNVVTAEGEWAWQRVKDEGHRHYKVIECGFKYNMMDIQAAQRDIITMCYLSCKSHDNI